MKAGEKDSISNLGADGQPVRARTRAVLGVTLPASQPACLTACACCSPKQPTIVAELTRPRAPRYFLVQVSSNIVIHLPSMLAEETCFNEPVPLRVNVSRDFMVIAPMCESPS